MNAAIAQTPTPAPSPAVSPHAFASPKPTPSAEPTARTAIVSCLAAELFAWPDRTSAPYGTSYPAARLGDAFGVIGTGTLTTSGANLTETTIDVFAPFGAGKHYWISTACIT